MDLLSLHTVAVPSKAIDLTQVGLRAARADNRTAENKRTPGSSGSEVHALDLLPLLLQQPADLRLSSLRLETT
jgi:hypothetical protein